MSGTDGGPIGRREVAHRLFSAEYEAADLEYSDSEEERAPNYVVTPTGARINRLFAVGVLTEVTAVSEEVLRARVADPTGAFVVYAGQYQPDAVAFLEEADVPSYVALTGKARTFQPDDGERVYTSVRPESIATVDADTRDRWTVQAAAHTLARVATMADALEREERGQALETALLEAGVAPGLAAGIALAIDHYDTTPAYLAALRETALAAAAVVAGERAEVPPLDRAPYEGGETEADLRRAPAVYGTLTARGAADESPERVGDPGVSTADRAPTGADEDAGPPETESPDGTDASAPPAANGELGDFEPAGQATATGSEGADGSAASPEEPGLYELDDDEREAIEAEYGTEFARGGDVADPGEAGIEPEAAPPNGAVDTGDDAGAAGPADDVDAEETTGDDEGVEAEDGVDLEAAVLETMVDLDDGDGAAREALVSAVAEETGADPAAVDDAIGEALLNGRCYEPADGRLKAI